MHGIITDDDVSTPFNHAIFMSMLLYEFGVTAL